MHWNMVLTSVQHVYTRCGRFTGALHVYMRDGINSRSWNAAMTNPHIYVNAFIKFNIVDETNDIIIAQSQ